MIIVGYGMNQPTLHRQDEQRPYWSLCGLRLAVIRDMPLEGWQEEAERCGNCRRIEQSREGLMLCTETTHFFGWTAANLTSKTPPIELRCACGKVTWADWQKEQMALPDQQAQEQEDSVTCTETNHRFSWTSTYLWCSPPPGTRCYCGMYTWPDWQREQERQNAQPEKED